MQVIHTVIADSVIGAISLNAQREQDQKRQTKIHAREEGMSGRSRKKGFCIINDGVYLRVWFQCKIMEKVYFF